MIGDCIQLAVEARVVRASIEERGHGIVLAKYKNQWVVWKVFRAHRAICWNCREGVYYRDRAKAEAYYAELVEESMPQISCNECGYYYSDPAEGCDACVGKKILPPTTMVGAGR